MSQQQEAAKQRVKKRKQRQAKPVLEQIPAVPAVAASQEQQHQQRRQPQQQQQFQQQQSQPPQDGLGSGNSKFARALGSTDYNTREQGLAALSRWLTSRQQVSEMDMLKLWKGIFFCFWHSDKEPVQVGQRKAG